MNVKVAKLVNINNDLEAFDFEGLTGADLYNALWLVRKIKRGIEGGEKAAGLDELGRDKLFLESEAVEGVYAFELATTKRIDYKRYDTLLSDRFGIPQEKIEALKNECKNESTCLRLNFNRKYSI